MTGLSHDRVYWCLSLLLSLAALACIGYTWATAQPQYKQGHITVSNQEELKKALELCSTIECEGGEEPIHIPTGFFIQSFSFMNANDVNINGYIWMRFPNNLPQDFVEEFIFPEEVNSNATKSEKIYTVDQEDYKLLGWYFDVIVRQSFDYSNYPLDFHAVWLRIWSKDFIHDAEIILVPDFAAYRPESLAANRFGLDVDIVPSGAVQRNLVDAQEKAKEFGIEQKWTGREDILLYLQQEGPTKQADAIRLEWNKNNVAQRIIYNDVWPELEAEAGPVPPWVTDFTSKIMGVPINGAGKKIMRFVQMAPGMGPIVHNLRLVESRLKLIIGLAAHGKDLLESLSPALVNEREALNNSLKEACAMTGHNVFATDQDPKEYKSLFLDTWSVLNQVWPTVQKCRAQTISDFIHTCFEVDQGLRDIRLNIEKFGISPGLLEERRLAAAKELRKLGPP